MLCFSIFLLDIFIRFYFQRQLTGNSFILLNRGNTSERRSRAFQRVSKKASFCHVSVGREKGNDNFGHVRVLSPSVTRRKAVMFVCARNLRIARIPFAVNSEHVLVDGLVISDVTATCLTLNANVTPRPDVRVRRDYSLMSASVVSTDINLRHTIRSRIYAPLPYHSLSRSIWSWENVEKTCRSRSRHRRPIFMTSS